jgi:hypothetical protein
MAVTRQDAINESKETEWRSALGDYSRVTDWLGFFREQLKERAWQDVIAAWVPILVPGYFGGLTHGLIRTAHAVRSFSEGANPSDLQINELARGLAYWAGTHRSLPGNPDRHERFEVAEALRHLPRVEPGAHKGPLGAGLKDLPGFTSAVESLAEVTDAENAISKHTAALGNLCKSSRVQQS